MKISAKTRYALAAVLRMAQGQGHRECVALINLADDLKISKIYLEQVFALLKRGGVVAAVKGSRGGYLLARPPEKITALEVMRAVDAALFAGSDATTAESAPDVERALNRLVFARLDETVARTLAETTLDDLAREAEKSRGENYMYYL